MLVMMKTVIIGAGKPKPLKSAAEHRCCRHLQILCEGVEFHQVRSRVALCGGAIQAVIHVIVNEEALGVRDGFLYSMKLLSEVKAGPSLFHHGDGRVEVPDRSSQPGNYVGMTRVLHRFS